MVLKSENDMIEELIIEVFAVPFETMLSFTDYLVLFLAVLVRENLSLVVLLAQ